MTRGRRILIAVGLVVLVAGVAVGVFAHGTSRGLRPGWYPIDPWGSQGMTAVEILSAVGPPDRWWAQVTYFTGAGARIEWGVADRTDDVLSADAVVLTWHDPEAAFFPVLRSYSKSYLLGELEPGEYRFRFYVNGTFVKEKSFEVAYPSG